MDFADDFTYFTFEEVLAEVRKLYQNNKHVVDIRLGSAANDEPTLNFYVKRPRRLGLHQLGLPGTFRCLKTNFIAANDS